MKIGCRLETMTRDDLKELKILCGKWIDECWKEERQGGELHNALETVYGCSHQELSWLRQKSKREKDAISP